MSTDVRVAEIVGRYREAIRRGDAVDPEELVRAHPDLESPLRRQLAALALLGRASGTFAAPLPSLSGRRVGAAP